MGSKKTYELRKKKGICVRCGFKPAKENRIMCSDCLEKSRNETNAKRKALIAHGFCPRCGKNKLFGNEKSCLECSMKVYEYNLTHSTRPNINYNQQRKEAGLCIKCGKRPPVSGKTKCQYCAETDRIRAREYRMRKGINVDRGERRLKGECYICGVPISDGALCATCKEKLTKNLTVHPGNDYWVRDNKLAFGGNVLR